VVVDPGSDDAGAAELAPVLVPDDVVGIVSALAAVVPRPERLSGRNSLAIARTVPSFSRGRWAISSTMRSLVRVLPPGSLISSAGSSSWSVRMCTIRLQGTWKPAAWYRRLPTTSPVEARPHWSVLSNLMTYRFPVVVLIWKPGLAPSIFTPTTFHGC